LIVILSGGSVATTTEPESKACPELGEGDLELIVDGLANHAEASPGLVCP